MRSSTLAILCLIAGGTLLVVYGLTSGGETSRAAPVLRPAGSSIVWAVGDGAVAGGDGGAVARLIAAGRPARFLYLGDVYENGTREEFARGYAPIFGRFRNFTAPTPGNHEWPEHRVGYDVYWKSVGRRNVRPAIPEFTGPSKNGSVPDDFAFRFAGWEIISLNSERDTNAQVPFLRDELSEPGTCRLAFWHEPRYSAGSHPDALQTEPFWRELEGHAALVLNGHDHNMQRWSRRGITQLIVGTGGHERTDVNTTSRPGLQFTNTTDFGALRLDLRPGAASWRFVAVGGRVLDSGTVPCQPLG